MHDHIFAGKLLVCDVDGTLLDTSNQLSRENMEAIHDFVSRGGKFTVATGRTVAALAVLKAALPISEPLITINGALISSLQDHGKAIWESTMNDRAASVIILDLHEKYPDLGIEIYTDTGVYPIHINEQVRWHARKEIIHPDEMSIEDVPCPWCKVVLVSNNAELQQIKQYLTAFLPADLKLIFSEDCFLDILDQQTSKGAALKILLKLIGISRQNTYVIGDNYNDLDMFTEAATSFAVANACAELKEMATWQVPSNDENGVANAIRKIEELLNEGKTLRLV